MRNLTKRQRVLRSRAITRSVAKEKRAADFASAKAFAEANPAEKLAHMRVTRRRNMRQVVAGAFIGLDSEYVATIQQLLEVQRMRNDAVTSTWQKAVADEAAKRTQSPLELKPL